MIWLDPAVWFWIPFAAGLAVLVLLPAARSRAGVVIVGILSLGCLTLSFVATTIWGWLFRDGLGPDSIESHGATAIRHFLGGGTGPALSSLLVVGALVVWACSRRSRRLDLRG